MVFDEAFVRSAVFHEPSHKERMAARARVGGIEDEPTGGDTRDSLYGGEGALDPDDAEYEELYAQRRPYRGHGRWHRTIAWLLAVLMGIGVVALTFAAVYRGAGGGRQPTIQPSPTGRVGAPPSAPVAVGPTH